MSVLLCVCTIVCVLSTLRVSVFVCVCVFQRLCSGQQLVADLHLCISVCVHMVEEATRKNMGR